MKRALLFATLIIGMLAMTGCYRTSFTYPDKSGGQISEQKQNFFIGGLIGPKKPFRADELCPSGVAGVETYATFGNACIGMLCAIYTPRTVKVTCAAGSAHNFYLDEDDNLLAHEYVDGESGERVVEDFSSDVL